MRYSIQLRKDVIKILLRLDANKYVAPRRGNQIYVRDRSVKGGGYWRRLRAGEGVVGTAIAEGGTNAPKDDLESKSIRELQTKAREKGVYRANHQTKEQLIKQIRLLDDDPEAETRARKTLEARRKNRQAVLKGLPKGIAKEVRLVDRVIKIVKANPGRAGILVAAAIAGFTQQKVEQVSIFLLKQ